MHGIDGIPKVLDTLRGQQLRVLSDPSPCIVRGECTNRVVRALAAAAAPPPWTAAAQSLAVRGSPARNKQLLRQLLQWADVAAVQQLPLSCAVSCLGGDNLTRGAAAGLQHRFYKKQGLAKLLNLAVLK